MPYFKVNEAQEPVSQPQLTEFKSDMRDDFAALRQDFSDLKVDIANRFNEQTRWMFTGFMAILGLLVAILFRLP